MEPEYVDNQVASAEIIVEEHTRLCVPEPVCHLCFKPWPCADVVWAHDILLREDLSSP